MTFTGFGEHAIDFYDGLVADNSRAYWEDNVEIYRRDVRAPMEALLAELEPEFAPGFGSAKVFRPYRDVRFSRDKTPYKTHCGAVIEPGRGAGAYYVELSPRGLRVGGGMYHLESDQLARFRQSVADDNHGPALVAILDKLVSSGWELRGEQLKTKPRGFDEDHPRIDLLRHKTLWVGKTFEPDDALHERTTLTRVRTAWQELRGLNEWALDHVGTTEKVRRR
ncbi:DUF2461 domain-containing protein [Thermocrispum municipale]|uniref:DUF2461 domain-containing protein n=1 Tax=Thermocrispum municipale TaxID=37926 RepID=UPI00040326D8|nr:DUF2461 domain-containing protein [Thermocrispum municipale]